MPQSVTLKADYTQKDLFFAAVQVQLEEFKKTQDPRCFESPTISEEDIEGNVILGSSEKHSNLVTNFYDDMKAASSYEAWEKVRAQSPFRLNAQGKREAKLSTFNKYELANFLAAIVLQFKEDMTVFLSQAGVRQQMDDLGISDGQLMLASTNVLQAIFAPLGEMAIDDEETRIIYGFCTSASTKFCLKDSMVPQPGDTIESVYDAMLKQISLTLTQPIGEEKCYGGMLGKSTPMEIMEGMLLGTELTYHEENISVPRGSYHIPDKSFFPAEGLGDEEIFKHVLLSNLTFLKQGNNHQTDYVFHKIMSQRLWEAFFKDKRCPTWLINKKEILLKMIEKKIPSFESDESISLPPEYTKSDLMLAAIEEQIPFYGVEGLGNANNARLFEAAKVTLDDNYGVTVSSSPHDSNVVSQFEDAMKAASETDAWKSVREKYPVQVANKGTAEEKLVAGTHEFSRHQCAYYFSNLANYFQELWPTIQAIIQKKRPGFFVSQELMLSLEIFLNKSIIPATEMGTPDKKLQSMISFLSQLQNRLFKKENLIETDSVDAIFSDIMRLISLMVTQPIGAEKPYGGIFKITEVSDPISATFDDFPEYYNEFKIRQPYGIPDETFKVPQGTQENEQILQNFFTFNLGFLRQADFKEFPPQVYQATLQRLWNAYIADVRCPPWIQEKEADLKNAVFQEGAQEKHVILYPLVKIFSSISDRIKRCDRNDINSLKSELSSLVKTTLSTLIKNARLIYSDEEQSKEALNFIKDQLKKLIIQYAKEKTLNAEFCSAILSEANSFLASFEKNDQAIDDALSIEEERSSRNIFYREMENIVENENFSQKDFLSDAFDMVEMRFLSMTVFEKDKMLMDVIALKGAIPDDSLAQILEKLVLHLDVAQLKRRLTDKALNASEALLIFVLGESWITASSQNKFTQDQVLSVLESNPKLFAKVFECAVAHHDPVIKRNIFNAVLLNPTALNDLTANLWNAAYKSDQSSLAAALSCKFLAPVESNVLTEKDYEQQLTFFFDDSVLGESSVAPIYYDVNRIETCIINLISQVEKFEAKESLIAIMQGDLPLHLKLRFIGAIAEGKLMRGLPESPGRILYKDLQCFYMVRKEDDIAAAFKAFLIARKEVPQGIDIEHHKQRLTLIQAQKDNAALPEDQKKSFEILFMRWVKFSKSSGDVIKKDDLSFWVLPTQEGAQHCYDAIVANSALSIPQKQAFIESLRVACSINSGIDSEVIFTNIEKDAAIIEFAHDENLLALLDAYEAAKAGAGSVDPAMIADRINECCSSVALEALKDDIEKNYPVVKSLFFFGKKTNISAVDDLLSLLASDKPMVDILLELKIKIAPTCVQELSAARAYDAVKRFLTSRQSPAISLVHWRHSE